METQKQILYPEDVAAECGVCLKTVYKELRSGRLGHVRAGDRYLISRKNLEKWLSGECNRQPAAC